jgi:putative colanic acid biosynthesis UDP-glucose lipid carrier transferase
MHNNNQTNNLIKWVVVLADFLILNSLLALFSMYHPTMATWPVDRVEVFWLVCNMALVLSEYKFSTIIHERLVSAGDVLRRVVMLTFVHTVLSYLLLKIVDLRLPVGKLLLAIGTCMFVCIILSRFIERIVVKRYRQAGRNTRMVTFVGADSELLTIYNRLINDPTTGYKLLGYYADEDLPAVEGNTPIKKLGTLRELIDKLNAPEQLTIGDEMYVSLSRRERETVKKLSDFCDRHVKRFYYVPVSVETMGINLKRELLEDIEIFTTYENPLANPLNKAIKRTFDVTLSLLFLLCTLPFLPLIVLLIKLQSPGPVFFKQLRTGIDGKDFYCYKFRSMHVNKDADRVQATKDDPRKYAFGNFMRKANIDELPQFWNVLKGDMSVVGPRPHMLAHTEMYSQLIDKYMVRHFVKPGVTGWAQVTGFRGETKELWQMEGRVRRDIWYMEHWTVWLDIRIIWLTVKSMIIHDEHAY